MRYIDLNPVRAGMVQQPSGYPPSSYRDKAHGLSEAALSHHPLYTALGEHHQERQAAYRGLFSVAIPEADLEQIREAISHELILGSSRFKSHIESVTNRAVRRGRSGRPKAGAQAQSFQVC